MQDQTPETETQAAEGTEATPEGAAEGSEVVAQAQTAISGLFDGDVTSQDLWTLWSNVGFPLVKVLILLVAVFVISGWAKRLVMGASRRAKVDETLSRFFGSMTRWGVLLLGVLAILETFGVSTTSFAAVIAAMGFAVGLALSGTLGNFAAGVMLLIFRPFKVGDVVSAAGITAKVHEIELFTTVFDTPDNRRIVVPNSSIFGSNIENITFHPKRRVDVAVGTEYSADLDRTREVLMEVARDVEGRLPEEDPVVYLNELGSSSINWAIRVWTTTADFWAVRERLTRNVKVALDNAGIGIPFPQMDIHLDRTDQPEAT